MAEIKLPKLKKISDNTSIEPKPRKKKKKILLMSDDLRMHSGVATVSKDIVFETLNEYDWVQIGGAINIQRLVKSLICLKALMSLE